MEYRSFRPHLPATPPPPFCHFTPAFKRFRRSLPSSSSPQPCTSPSPVRQHTHAVKMTKGLTPSLLKTMIYHLFFFPLHNPHLSLTQRRHLPPSLSLLAQDINQLRWKFHNCACWEGFEQNCAMNFLKGIFTSCSARLGRRRKVRPWGFMGLDSSLLK